MPAKKTFQDDQVIEKIMHLFWQQGYYHTSMDEIVITSGVKKQSLCNAIGDKHTLYLRALQRYHQQTLMRCTQAMQRLEQDGAAPLAILSMLFSHDLTTSEQPAGDLMANAVAEFGTTDTDVQQAVSWFYDDYLTLMAAVILKGQANEQIINNQSSMTLAQALLEARIGLQTRLRQGSQPDIQAQQQAWMAFLARR
ncbi:Transcriptional regulator TetR family [Lactiplantibacillus plantarum]|uniref:TetR/AcrR family transcriptional regulator n=1 Tax=Lactiplantibacillus plantarum TaxID=1590 RepID=UPI0007C138E4|nr:TetR/AcrR family transcriptional regulator [Lactiplantibacillus plantarum]KZT96177.1 Transcriptional regulator TetR family [Lactiplantibacillus plantarum]